MPGIRLDFNRLPMNSKSAASRRNLGLDLLRSIAIAIVLSNHAALGFFFDTGRLKWVGMSAGISSLSVLSIEWLFVLSGFLIGTMMIRSFEAGRNWWGCARDFWYRRWFRTLPNYYLFLAVNALLVHWGIAKGDFRWSFALFSQNLAWTEQHPLFFGEAWSLALDEWFYFVLPLLIGCLMLLARLPLRGMFWIASSVLIAAPVAARFWLASDIEFFAWDANVRRVTVFHLDATGWGVLAAILNRWHPDWWNRGQSRKALAGILLTALACGMIWHLAVDGWRQSPWTGAAHAMMLTLPAAGLVLFLPYLCSIPLNFKPLRYVATRTSLYSYSIYLVHFPALFVTCKLFGVDSSIGTAKLIATVLIWLASTIAVSALVFHSFEGPVSDIRERFTRRVNANPF